MMVEPCADPSLLTDLELAGGMASQDQVASPSASGHCHMSVSPDRVIDQHAV